MIETLTPKSAIIIEKTKGKDFHLSLARWYHLELNQGHTDFQSVALPTELWYPFILVLQK